MHSVNPFQIRPAVKSDVEDIAKIVKESFTQYCNMIGINTTDALCESEEDILNDIINKYVYIIYWEEIPVGSIRVEIKNNKSFISRFAVLPDYQCLGIGSKVLSFIEKYLISLQIETVELYSAVQNNRLKDFYLKKGYQIISINNLKGYQRGLFRKRL